MNICGIDVSTRAIDLVLLDMDSDQARWSRCHLENDGLDWLGRLRNIGNLPRDFLVTKDGWDDILAVGIERPAGRYAVDKVAMVFGAVVSRIPARVLVQPWQPAEWRKACGLKGNATKSEVAAWVVRQSPTFTAWADETLSFDACDAYCVAYATRQALETEQTA